MILVTRPNDDNGLNYLYYWSREVIDVAKKKSFQIIDLAEKKANRKNFKSYIEREKPGLIWVNGHGDYGLVTGHDKEVLLDISSNWFRIDSRVFVARSCRCGSELGKRLVTEGVGAFIGYVDDYIIKTSRFYFTRSWMDPVAALFLGPSNQIVLSLLKGHTAEESNTKSKELLLKNLKRVLANDANDQSDVGRWLWHDYKCQVILGNSGSRI
ncbi:hypothetical protein HYV64_02960 [Candidatus Shapirobacteria bacterium]|nr:hypothetical protein [Candidatus Shapirobacteria bacterium]